MSSPWNDLDRARVAAVLETTLARLEQECTAKGRATVFRALRGRLTDPRRETPDSAEAHALGMNEQALRAALLRLRKRLRELLREELRGIPECPADVEPLLRALLDTPAA